MPFCLRFTATDFGKAFPERIAISGGDIVTIETVTHHAADDLERMMQVDEEPESVQSWTPERTGVDRRSAGSTDPAVCEKGSGMGQGVHILIGSVYGRGAEPGDILEVR